MKIVAKYRFYKRFLQILLAVNGFFICAGAVAMYRYMQSGQMTALDLGLIGVGTLFFGILLPALAIMKLTKTLESMRRQTEEAVARWMAGWMESYKNYDDEPLRDPYFWLNIALMSFEVFGENSHHPVVRMVSDFAPIMKREINKPSSKKASKSKRATA